MQFNTDTVYKLKDMSSTLITIVNQNNDEISTKVYNSKVGKFFHFKDIDGQYITVHFNKDSYSRLPILHFEEVSSEDVIQTFLNDPDLGINVESAEEFKLFNNLKRILKINESDISKYKFTQSTMTLYNTDTYSTINFSKEKAKKHYIPYSLFYKQYLNTLKKAKTMTIFTKEFLLQSEDKYFIQIHSEEQQIIVENIFSKNNISKPLNMRYNDNQEYFFLTNTSTWATKYDKTRIIIDFTKWLSIVQELLFIDKFEPNTLYELHTFKDLKEQFGLNISGNINVPSFFTKEMEKDPELKKFFIPTKDNISSNNITIKTEIRDWDITPQMCKKVSDISFFKRFLNYSMPKHTRLRFLVDNESEDKSVRNIISRFNLQLTATNTYKLNGKGSYYTLEGSSGSEDLAKNNHHTLIPLHILQDYVNNFEQQVLNSNPLILDISTIYETDKDRKLIIESSLKLKHGVLNEQNPSFIASLTNGTKFSFDNKPKNNKYGSRNQDDFLEKVKEFPKLSTEEMLNDLFEYQKDEVPSVILEPETPISTYTQLKIKDITFDQAITKSNDITVKISIQSKNQLKELLNLFKEYSVPYFDIPKFQRGMTLSVTDNTPFIQSKIETISFTSFKKLEEHNTQHQSESTHIIKKMKQFYLKKIEHKHFHNDEEVSKDYLQTQGEVYIEEISGTIHRYFTAKDLGIVHDGLTEKSQRIMDQIINELDSPESIIDKEWVLLLGSSGSGKTTIAKKYFSDKNQKYIKVQGHSRLSADEILGYESIVDHVYKRSKLRDCVEYGWGYILDEGHTCDPNTLMIYNGLKDGLIEFPDKTIEVHQDFRFIITGNSVEFSEKYNSANKWDYAFKARFSIIDYNLNLLDLGERYGAKYIKQIPNAMDLDPRDIQRKVRHIKQKEQLHEDDN